jgi:uncharacterized membrane protein YbhN (UPF0104 family)
MVLLKAEYQVNWRRSGSAFVLIKVVDLIVLGGYLTLATWFVRQQISIQWYKVTQVFVAVLWGGVGSIVLGWLWRRRISSWLGLLLGELGDKVLHKVQQSVLVILHTFQDKRVIFQMFVLSTVYMTLSMSLSYIALRIFEIKLNVWAVIYTTTWIQFASWLPIQIMGGLGVNEAISVYFFSSFGIPAPKIAAAAIGWRGIFYMLTASTAIFLPLLSWGRK